jgi:hypothetical protein
MSSKEYIIKDPVVDAVVGKLIARSNVGFQKYGRSLHEERTMGIKNLFGYLKDVQEELMDACNYIQAAMDELKDFSDEALVQKFIEE